jgi:hypothetical protein
MLSSRLLSLFVLASALSSAACLGAGHSVNAYGGTRFLEADEWDDLDNPIAYGADVVLKVDLPWLAVEGGWFHADQDEDALGTLTDVDLSTDEYFVGLRLVPWDIVLEPYGSAGVTYVDSSLDATAGGGGSADDDDEILAYYARLGLALKLDFLRLGVDGRATFGSDVDLDTLESDVDGYQLTGFLGLAF